MVRLAEKLKGVLPIRDNVLPLLNDIVTPRIDQETLALYYDSDDDDNAPLAACGSRVLPRKRLLEEQYSIRFPSTHTSKRSRQLFADRYSSTFQNPQQEQDFKLAVELQHVENMAQGKCDRGNLYEVANDDENTCHISTQVTASISNDTDDSQGTVDAAANALLSLKQLQ